MLHPAQVMDDGQVMEFDTPLNLFRDSSSSFHQMCVKSAITLEEIEKAVASVRS